MKFIAYFDYLGFKQFIENNDLDYQKRIMGNNFRDMESALGQGKLVEASHGVIADLSNHKVNCINFSDTVVFWTNDDSEQSIIEILDVASKFNRQGTTLFFPARGALVHGEMEYIDFKNENSFGGLYNINSVFGKGLVTAHQKAESQQWSGTVIDSSFVNKLVEMGHNPDSFLLTYAKKYIVPYKNGVKLEQEFALNLVSYKLNPVAFDNTSKGIIRNFGNHDKDTTHPDVQEKINNTITFLETYKSKTAFSDFDYKILIEHFQKNEFNQFYLFIIKRALYVKKQPEPDETTIEELMKVLDDKAIVSSLNPQTKDEIISAIDVLYEALISRYE